MCAARANAFGASRCSKIGVPGIGSFSELGGWTVKEGQDDGLLSGPELACVYFAVTGLAWKVGD